MNRSDLTAVDTLHSQHIKPFRPSLILRLVLALVLISLFSTFATVTFLNDESIVEVVVVIGIAIVAFFIAGRFPAIFVALLQGGMGILVYGSEFIGITVPEGATIVAFAGLSLIGMVANLVHYPGRINIYVRPVAQFTFALTLLIIVSVSYSWHDQALTKAGLFVATNLVSFCVVATLRQEQRRQLYTVLLIVGLLVAGGIIISFISGNRGTIAGRYQGFGLDVISGARAVGLAIIILLYSPVRFRLHFIFLTLLGSGFLLAGTRGPLLALVATIFITPLLLSAPSVISFLSKRSLVLVVAAAIGLLGMVYFAISNPEMLIVDDWGPFRILNSTNLQDANITTRFDHISLAIAEFMEKPLLGWGIAGYGGTEPYSSPVVFNWPHNITFEVLVELGIWGFILAGSAILLSYFDARKLYRRSRARHNDYIQQEALMIVIALTYTLINAHISGMLHINRTIWLAMGLIQAAIYEMPRVLPIENPTGNNPGSIVEAEEQLLPSN